MIRHDDASAVHGFVDHGSPAFLPVTGDEVDLRFLHGSPDILRTAEACEGDLIRHAKLFCQAVYFFLSSPPPIIVM